jgi:hypothetical protein
VLGAPLVGPLGRELRWQRRDRGLDARADVPLEAAANLIYEECLEDRE